MAGVRIFIGKIIVSLLPLPQMATLSLTGVANVLSRVAVSELVPSPIMLLTGQSPAQTITNMVLHSEKSSRAFPSAVA
jgi:hypothetical protein